MAAGGAAGETGRETETDVATLPSRTSLSAASSSVCSLDERLLSSVSHLHCVLTRVGGVVVDHWKDLPVLIFTDVSGHC